LRDWLPDDHLAWFVIDAVAAMDLAQFFAAYRRDGDGRAAHDPAMMVALLLYSYARGERSSRRIERRCLEDVAARVICANQTPDHPTIARFRQRHEEAIAGLFGEVLALCAEAGLVEVGVVAVDGTKVHANASHHATRDYEQIAAEILEDAAAVDAEEDERFGERRGDELPASCRPPRVGAVGSARRSAASTSSALLIAGRSSARGQTACASPSGASRKSIKSSARRTPTTRPTAPAGG
jgi:transposase